MSEVRTILLRLPNWLGDSVMCSPAFSYLKTTYPNAQFSLVGTNASCGIYEREPRVKHIFIDRTKTAKSRLLATFHFAKEIGTHDIAISFSNSFFSALLLFFTRSFVRLGFGKNARSFLLTNAPKIPKAPLNRPKYHQVIAYLKLICALDEVFKNASKDFLSLRPEIAKYSSICIDSDDLAYALSILPLSLIAMPLNLNPLVCKIGINPGAAYGSAKRWEQEYFIDIIKYFLLHNNEVYLFGSSIESSANTHIAQSISAIFKNTPQYLERFFNLTDKTNLNALIDYIAAMNVFITNDSGPMHIAAALKTPIVAMFGPTDVNETAPYGVKNVILLSHRLPCAPCKKRECPLKHHQCMKLITPKEVIDATYSLISQRKNENIHIDKHINSKSLDSASSNTLLPNPWLVSLHNSSPTHPYLTLKD